MAGNPWTVRIATRTSQGLQGASVRAGGLSMARVKVLDQVLGIRGAAGQAITDPPQEALVDFEHFFENNLIHPPLPASLKALRPSLSRLTPPKGYAPGLKESLRSIHPLSSEN